ncbi:MAG: hypothetical protein QOH84_5251 [Kribbellaceae bacterium]|nr:hypothetical protein [Kribbellaceae bacterium]
MTARMPLRYRIAILVAAVVAISAVLVFRARAEEPPERTVALIVGLHAGAAGLLDGKGNAIPEVATALDQFLQGPGKLTVIANDGRPHAVRTIELEYDGSSGTNRQDKINANKRKVEEALRAAAPVAEQADPTAALKLAGDTVRGKRNPAVVVFDNGLSTTGTLLMQLGAIDIGTDVADLARQSKDTLIGSFDGIVVDWHGLCSVADPQPRCNAGVQQQLQKYYQQLIEDADGKVKYDDAPLAGVPPTTAMPVVDVVHWRVQRLPTAGPTTTPSPPALVKVLTDDLVRFDPNSDAYVYPERAEVAIAALAGQLRTAAYPRIYVAGCTARDPASTEQQMLDRGQSRADTIARDLQAHKVTARFVTRGLGWQCPGYRPGDHEANRRVIVSSEPIR